MITDGGMRPSFLSRIHEKQTHLLVLLLASGIALTYWHALKYPFVQDDLGLIHSFTVNSFGTQVKAILSASGKVFYRPVGELYLLGLYEIFGLNPVGYHIMNLLMHMGASLLVVFVVQHLGFDKFLAWSTGLFYGVALTIHLDPLIWIVGIFDIGGSFLMFLSILLFLRHRTTISVIVFILALFTKEAVVVLPLVLFIICKLKQQQTASLFESAKEILARLVPYLAPSLSILYSDS